MKKTMIILSALLALVACNKEMPQNEGAIDPSKVVFNINVQTADDAATKGVKTGWVSGDVVYVFFEDNTTQYVKMTYSGSAWSYSDKDGGNSYTGLTLTDSGKKLSAVYMPSFVIGEATPSYTDKWTIGTTLGGYILKAETVAYSVYSRAGNIATLEATLSMTAPANMMQIYINESELVGDDVDNEYVLNMTNVKPFTFDGIVPGGAATITTGTANFPLPGYYGTLGSESGYYFWGVLNKTDAKARTYNFQVVKQNAEKKYAISSKSKTVNAKITGPKAIKLTSLTNNGNFVCMGYNKGGGPLWATGNLNDDGSIADPLEAGDYYKWGYTTPYDVAGSPDAWNNYKADALFEDTAAAKIINGCMPTSVQIDSLRGRHGDTVREWKSDWTSLGDTKGGYLFTSKSNGISLFFAAAGLYTDGELKLVGDIGFYWSSTPKPIEDPEDPRAYRLHFSDHELWTSSGKRPCGFPVRPVQN